MRPNPRPNQKPNMSAPRRPTLTLIPSTSGYTLLYGSQFPLASIPRPCISTIDPGERTPATITATVSHGTGSTTTSITSGLLVRHPWHIAWRARDRKTLSPRPPKLDRYETITSWIPGSSVDPASSNRGNNSGTLYNASPYFFLVIGLPVIGGVLIDTAVCGCCWC